MNILDNISYYLHTGAAKDVAYSVQIAINEGYPAEEILQKGLLHGMDIIGELFQNGDCYVPETIVAARAMNAGLEVLKPLLQKQCIASMGKVVLGTVKGDMHDIGKNLVKLMMESNGLEIIDLGTDVPAEQFVQVAINEQCQVIAMSALLTTSMGAMKEVIKQLDLARVRERFKVMIGGAPVSTAFCEKIGADAYTRDATAAASQALKFCKPEYMR
ncbi:MAG: cobalamin-binding protein [Lachnospiraceae bacterium]|nr:cobalamin-binding protein [Lachnospiraceae bacterium]MCI9547103.1 cobalamin-binding protein [Lachnospiraceae bacterium]